MPRNRRSDDPRLAATIGINARAARHAADRRLSDVAGEVGISMSMLSKVENARTLPSVPVLAGLARALGVPVGALCEEREVAA